MFVGERGAEALLQTADLPALDSIKQRLRDEQQQLYTSKKTLLAENHQSFLSIEGSLETVSLCYLRANTAIPEYLFVHLLRAP